MNRTTVQQAIVFAIVIGVCGQVAGAGGTPTATDARPAEGLQPSGVAGGGPQLPDRPTAGLDRDAPTAPPFVDLGPDGAVAWMNALLSTSAGAAPPDRIVPPIAIGAGMTHREDDEPSFENERRETIYRDIAESPGRYVPEVVASTGIPESTVRYHVRVLEDEGLLRSVLIRGKHRLYPPSVDQAVVTVEAALDDDPTASILDAVARLEPATVSALADDLDAAPSTVSYHLQRLAADGLVERERTGQSVVTRLDPTVRSYLQGEGLADEADTDTTAG